MVDSETIAAIVGIIASCISFVYIVNPLINWVNNHPDLTGSQRHQAFQKAYGAMVYVYPAIILSMIVTFTFFQFITFYFLSNTEVTLSDTIGGAKWVGNIALSSVLCVIITEKYNLVRGPTDSNSDQRD
tara:strand:- start:152 stop:538 length:387 start_codon:yes stop_codon:yes gene_type:complete